MDTIIQKSQALIPCETGSHFSLQYVSQWMVDMFNFDSEDFFHKLQVIWSTTLWGILFLLNR